MMLWDARDGSPTVEVGAFTVSDDGETGPAQKDGHIRVGDRVTKVGKQNTEGLDYEGVLNLIVNGPRPLKIHFSRSAAADADVAQQAELVPHEQWEGTSSETKEAQTN